jgi:hypothetical protein
MARLDPRGLFELQPGLTEAEALDGLVLVQALDGFIDAGGAKRLAREHLLRNGSTVVAAFDVDQLLDYRARRPVMVFAGDHWESYADPDLALHLVRDDAGTPFLVLAGPEPDVQWERFVTAVQLLVEQLSVRLTVGLNSIPMAVPHTRPVLEQAGRDSAGFAVSVPHYLADAEYPAAAVVLLDSVGRLTGLSFDTHELAEAAVRTREEVDRQVAGSAEVAGVVQALEAQYDTFQAGRTRNLLDADAANLPTADELGAEFEQFLAEHGRSDPQA